MIDCILIQKVYSLVVLFQSRGELSFEKDTYRVTMRSCDKLMLLSSSANLVLVTCYANSIVRPGFQSFMGQLYSESVGPL